MTTEKRDETDRKISSALTLSSFAFAIVFVFVILWPIRKKLLLICMPAVERCFKWAQKEIKSTRKALSNKSKKSSLATPANEETLKASENADESHVYATIQKHRKDVAQKRSPSCTSNDSDFSASKNVIDETCVVSVELHVYDKVPLESCEKSSMPLEEITMCDSQCLDNIELKKINQTSEFQIDNDTNRKR